MAPTSQPPGAGEEFARAQTVAALAGQLDGLRRDLATATAAATSSGQAATARVDALAGRVDQAVQEGSEIVGQVRELAATVERLSEAVTALAARPRSEPAPTWMLLPAEDGLATDILEGLAGWLRAVYLRYSDGAAGLPECWCWHPDVVEELLWCMHAWIGAYHGPKASVGLAGDWHDRQRPGVVRRIQAVAGTCSRERHQRRDGGWRTAPTGAPTVPAEAELPVIARWWGTARDHPAPEPPPRGPQRVVRPGPPRQPGPHGQHGAGS